MFLFLRVDHLCALRRISRLFRAWVDHSFLAPRRVVCSDILSLTKALQICARVTAFSKLGNSFAPGKGPSVKYVMLHREGGGLGTSITTPKFPKVVMLHEGGGVFQKPLQKVSFLAVYYCTTPDWVCEFVATIAQVSVALCSVGANWSS